MPPKLTLVFRKPSANFNSIENVFNALKPYFEKELELDNYHLPWRTSGVFKMRKNYYHFRKRRTEGLIHITGHENYIIMAAGGEAILTLHDIHSAFTGKTTRDRFIKKYWLELPLKKAKRVTVISEFSAREVEKMFPGAKGKLTVIPNPVDDRIIYKKKQFNAAQPRILLVGTKANKNLENSIVAMSELNCNVVILGRLTKYQLELLKYANFDYENLHALSYEEVIQEYIKCDLLCFPSSYEGFGMPILEAQASGRPVVTSNCGAMKDTAGEGACLVDPGDVNSIKEGVQKVISNADYRDGLIKAGLENVKQYNAKSIADKYLQVYREVLNET